MEWKLIFDQDWTRILLIKESVFFCYMRIIGNINVFRQKGTLRKPRLCPGYNSADNYSLTPNPIISHVIDHVIIAHMR